MKFSIIIPVYNAESYLARCIDSVLLQEHKDFEVIMVDDGSSDKSLAICKQYAEKDDRIQVISKPNGGPGSARNAGLKCVNGDYICFMDADDEVAPEWLTNYSRELSIDDADILFQNYIIEYRDGKRQLNSIYPKGFSICTTINSPSIYTNCFKNNWVLQTATWSKCYKASIIKDHNVTFIESIKVYEDFMFYAHVLNVASMISFCKGAAYVYHYNSDSLSRSKESRERVYEACDVVFQDNIWHAKTEVVLSCLRLFLLSLPICRVYHQLSVSCKNILAKLLILHKVYLPGLRSVPYNFSVTLRSPMFVKLSLALQFALFKK